MISFERIFDSCSGGLCYSSFFQSQYTVQIHGHSFELAIILALFLCFWGLKQNLALSFSACFLIITLFGCSKITLAVIFFCLTTYRSSFSKLTFITSFIGAITVGKTMALINLLWLLRDVIADNNRKSIQLSSLLCVLAVHLFMQTLAWPPVIEIVQPEASVLRLDPQALLNSFEYHFPRHLFWRELATTGLVGLLGLSLINLSWLNVIFVLICGSIFIKILDPLFWAPLIMLITPFLKMSKTDKLLALVGALFLGEVSASSIEGSGHLLPISGIERLLDGVWPMSVGVIYLWFVTALLLRFNIVLHMCLVLWIAAYFDPVVFHTEVEKTVFETQIYPKSDLNSVTKLVKVGRVKLSQKLTKTLKENGIVVNDVRSTTTTFVFSREVDLKTIRVEWPTYNHRPVTLRVSSGDCKRTINLRSIPAKRLKNLGGLTFAFTCDAATELVLEDLHPKIEFPFTIDRIYYD